MLKTVSSQKGFTTNIVWNLNWRLQIKQKKSGTFLNKVRQLFGNYSREETIRGNTVNYIFALIQHRLRGHSKTKWTKFYPIITPIPLEWTFYILSTLCQVTPPPPAPSRGLSTAPQPPFSCPRSYWMTHNKKSTKFKIQISRHEFVFQASLKRSKLNTAHQIFAIKKKWHMMAPWVSWNFW